MWLIFFTIYRDKKYNDYALKIEFEGYQRSLTPGWLLKREGGRACRAVVELGEQFCLEKTWLSQIINYVVVF